MAIKLREFRVLDRSVKMIVLFVLGFFLFVGVFAVLALGGSQIFSSAFPEAIAPKDEFRPPMPTPKVPFFSGPPGGQSPEVAAEELRQRLQAAAADGDLKTAYRLEKELIQLLAESGVRYMVEDDPDSEDSKEDLPTNW